MKRFKNKKLSINGIIIIILIILNIILLYRLDKYNVDSGKKPYTLTESISHDKINLNNSTLRLKEGLYLIIYINEQNCNFCNNFVVSKVKKISSKFSNHIVIFVYGTSRYLSFISKSFDLNKNISIIKEKELKNNYSEPTCFIVDKDSNIILSLSADIKYPDKINLFFKKVVILFKAS
jgi:thioredoxin-related protein